MLTHYPKKLALFLIVLTLVLMSGLTYEVTKYQDTIIYLQKRHIPVIELSGIIIRLNELLSHSIEMLMMTKNKQWEEKYNNYRFPMEDSLEQLYYLIPNDFFENQKIEKIERKDLFHIELEILSFLKNDQSQLSNKLNENYPIMAQGFRTQITTQAEFLGEYFETSLNIKRRNSRYLIYVYIFALAIWVILWFFLIQRYKANSRDTEKAQRSLKNSQKRFQDIAMATGDFIWEINDQNKFTFVSEKSQKLYGHDASELIGMNIFELIDPKDRGELSNFLNAHILQKMPIENYQHTRIKGDGNNILIESTCLPLFDQTGRYKGFRGVDKDITLRKKAEKDKEEMQKQIFQSAKLASIGTLASGVAHELNNPLTGILGFTEILYRKKSDPKKIDEYCEKITKIAKRMKGIIDHLRQFSRESSSKDWELININESINNALILLNSQLKNRNIRLELELNTKLPTIWGDINQLESIFQNLIINSRDAFESIKDDRVKLIQLSSTTINEGVQIIYQDNAGGIPKELVNNVFDPFFTTKEVGKGTGLGLSIVHGIVKEHKGSIELISAPNKGSKFIIGFPVDRRNTARQANPNTTTKIIETPSAQKIDISAAPEILVVDDEAIIGEVLEELLGETFQITYFQDAEKAVEGIKSKTYDLVLTDMSMPKISGMDIFFAVQKYQKTTPVILMSGHMQDAESLENAKNCGIKEIIYKPFVDIDEVILKIKNNLAT